MVSPYPSPSSLAPYVDTAAEEEMAALLGSTHALRSLTAVAARVLGGPPLNSSSSSSSSGTDNSSTGSSGNRSGSSIRGSEPSTNDSGNSSGNGSDVVQSWKPPSARWPLAFVHVSDEAHAALLRPHVRELAYLTRCAEVRVEVVPTMGSGEDAIPPATLLKSVDQHCRVGCLSVCVS
jgi:hypothetical protein